MPKQNAPLLAFNRGRISPNALARIDLEGTQLYAETQTNYIPRSMGSMMLRPGLGFIEPIIPKFTNTTLTVNVGGAKTLASSTGRANAATVYTATLVYAGSLTVNIAVTGSAAQTYATLLDEIYDDMLAATLGGEEITVGLVGGNIVFEVQLHGNSSSLTLADSGANHLFETLTSFVSIGTAVLGETDIDSDSKLIDFVFSKDDTAYIAFVDEEMRVLVDDGYINPDTVSTKAVNGHFLYTLDNWTDNDDSGATSTFAAGSDGRGYMSLVGTIFAYARRYQQITVAGGDANDLHQCRIIIARGVVGVHIGTSAGDGSYFTATLGKGVHWCSFTPTGTFYVQFSSNTKYASLVDSIWFNSGGLVIDTEYTESDFPLIRHSQSGDVVYLACEGIKPQKIERRNTFSWGLADYLPDDGPFRPYNTTGITMTPSALSGDINLTASKAFFQSGHVGALFLVDSLGQKVSSTLTGQDQWSNTIRVTGTTRAFFATRASIGTNTVTLQRSIDGASSWVDVATYTTDATSTVDDGLDNQIVYYRIGIKTGNYTAGSPVVTLEYSQGSIAGICRVTGITSTTVATAIVLREFGGTAATRDWREGAWSDYRGFPSAVALFESRLWWAGKQRIDGSYSDGFETYDPDLEGDARPISRTIGYGVSDNINWMVGAQRLLLGTDSRVLSATSSSNNEPLTQDNFGLKTCSTQGSARISPIEIDDDVVYAHATKARLIRLTYDESVKAGYKPDDLTALCPEICEPEITHLAIQRQPDTRIHCVRSDGTVGILAHDAIEDVWAPIDIESTGADGEVEDCIILPGDEEDRVYYIVKRAIPDASFVTDADVVRYIEKWALESECVGGTQNKQLDSFVTYSGVSATTLTGLDHLEGMSVYVWGNATIKVQGPFTVSSGSITITYAVTSAVIGLQYTAQYKSNKLAYASGLGTALLQRKRPAQVGLIMRNVHPSGIQYGQDFDHLDYIPQGTLALVADAPDTNSVMETYDKDMFSMNSSWDTDARLCLQTVAPYPCTLLAAVVAVQTNDKG